MPKTDWEGIARNSGSSDFRRLNPELFPNALKADRKVQSAKPKRDKKAALGRADEGKEKGIPRTTVRFVGYRVRPLDPDNFAGGCKDLLDGLRHASLISGDEPWRINFETRQEKVGSYKDERTVIEIES